ncbi:MAG: hypothetical protein Q8881_02975 [Sweet potato little leaf phytoplasma]|nr:hypothetical protein [Sweet potato little leaf phytoplasma]
MNPDEFTPNFALRDVSDETAEFQTNFALVDVPRNGRISVVFRTRDVSAEMPE